MKRTVIISIQAASADITEEVSPPAVLECELQPPVHIGEALEQIQIIFIRDKVRYHLFFMFILFFILHRHFLGGLLKVGCLTTLFTKS